MFTPNIHLKADEGVRGIPRVCGIVLSHLSSLGKRDEGEQRAQNKDLTWYVLSTSRMPPTCSWAEAPRLCLRGQHCAHTRVTSEQSGHARHRGEFSHVVDKVHSVWAHGGYTHDDLGSDVEDGEQYDRDIVGQELAGAPVILEEHGPTAKLKNFVRDVDSTRWKSVNVIAETTGRGIRTKRASPDPQTHHHPAYGCNFEANGSVDLSNLCTFIPW